MRITSLALAPLVSLVLILMPTVILVHRDKPHGLPLQIAYQEKDCSDNNRLVVARVMTNGKVSLNNEVELRRSELADRLHQIFRSRAERVLFIEADPDLPVSSVAEVIDISQKQVDFVAILTPAAGGTCLSIHLTSPTLL